MKTLTKEPASLPPATTDVFGCDVVIAVRAAMYQTKHVEKHFVGSESACRHKAKMVTGCVGIVSVKPLTKDVFIRAYGDPRRARR